MAIGSSWRRLALNIACGNVLGQEYDIDHCIVNQCPTPVLAGRLAFAYGERLRV